ncbi:hypothetical protein M9H77_07168 [Catharanthus roseus]|uniref:Uncharacterized protein n=1 Tax=Catharanthus roseus TaxID=4058 RepID=A0ACC0BUG1_CATRO|nr:hypothetical protein M9H77_07168 [Catharanthus roseus]
MLELNERIQGWSPALQLGALPSDPVLNPFFLFSLLSLFLVQPALILLLIGAFHDYWNDETILISSRKNALNDGKEEPTGTKKPKIVAEGNGKKSEELAVTQTTVVQRL